MSSNSNIDVHECGVKVLQKVSIFQMEMPCLNAHLQYNSLLYIDVKIESTNQAADSHPSSDVHNLMFVWSLALLPREGGAAPPPGAAVLTI